MSNFKIVYVSFYTFLIAFAFSSCKTEKESEVTPSKVKQKDSILYQDLRNTDTISSIDSFLFVGVYDQIACYRPMPEDSSAFYEIDLNLDGVNDFVISHSHWLGMSTPPSPHNQCDKYKNFEVFIKAIEPSNYIMYDESEGFPYVNDAALLFNAGEIINDQKLKKSKSTLTVNSASRLSFHRPDSTQNTIGVIITLAGKTHYGWISLEVKEEYFKLKECAINLTAENDIYANQTTNFN